MEKIKMYSPHSMFTKETVKMAKARAPQIKKVGGYCEIRNPVRSAIARKKTSRRFVRTVFYFNLTTESTATTELYLSYVT